MLRHLAQCPFHSRCRRPTVANPDLLPLKALSIELGASFQAMRRRAAAGRLKGVVDVSARGAQHRRWRIARRDLVAHLARADKRKGVATGRRCTDEARHSFRPWARALDWIVREIDEAPLLDGHEAVQQRTSDPIRCWLREIAPHATGQTWWSASTLVSASEMAGLAIPGTRDGGGKENAHKIIGGAMGRLFGTSNKVDVDGVTVHRFEDQEEHGKARRRYAFQLSGQGDPEPPNPEQKPNDAVDDLLL